MLEQVKKIKLEELNKQKQECTEEIENIKQQFYQIRETLWRLQGEDAGGLTVQGKFTFFQKWITRRQAYKRYKEQVKRLKALPKLINEAREKVSEEKEKAEEILRQRRLYEKSYEISQEMEKIENAETLKNLEISLQEAIEMLENNGDKVILTDSDKISFYTPSNYSSTSSLMCVHKTNYMPTANIIKSAKDSNVNMKKEISLNGKQYEYSYNSARSTVHFAVNDEVSSHSYGSWDDCKYAVLIPFEDIPKEKIGRAAPMDTFTRGSVDISENTWILCPKNEVDQLKVFNPKAHILGYEGENVKGFSRPLLTQLGYPGEEVGMWGWEDNTSNKRFYELMEKEEIKIGTHTYTYFAEDERILTSINHAVALSKMLRDNHLITSVEDIPNIMEQLQEKGDYYGRILLDLCTKSETEPDKEPESIKANNRQTDIFFSEMKKNGFDISPNYQNVLKELSKVSIYECNDENKDIVFRYPENATETEKRTIEELKTTLTSKNKYDPTKVKEAFNIFIANVIGETILHSQEKEFSSAKIGEEK